MEKGRRVSPGFSRKQKRDREEQQDGAPELQHQAQALPHRRAMGTGQVPPLSLQAPVLCNLLSM